jgi:hypothetical protein
MDDFVVREYRHLSKNALKRYYLNVILTNDKFEMIHKGILELNYHIYYAD